MSQAEATTILLDPRFKMQFFADMATASTGLAKYKTDWPKLGRDVATALEKRLAAAMDYEKVESERLLQRAAAARAAASASTRSAASLDAPQGPQGATPPIPALTSPAARTPPTAQTARGASLESPVAPPGRPAASLTPPEPKKRKLGGALARISSGRASSAPTLATATATKDLTSLHLAKRDVGLYLQAPRLDLATYPLTVTEDVPYLFSPTQCWASGHCVPTGVELKPRFDGANKLYSYIAVTAFAYHGGVAASARPERTFRDTSFINNVLKQRMAPSTIARAALLRRNKDLRIPVSEIVKRYNAKHPDSKRRGKDSTPIVVE